MIKVGINGFGRMGRLALRVILQKYKDKILPVAINTSGKIPTVGWAHLFEYDTAYGKYPNEIKVEGNNMIVGEVSIPVLGIREPAEIPWGKFDTEIVIESTGVFLTQEQVAAHLRDSVSRVALSAPPKDENIPMYIIGVNEDKISDEKIISCASCTTNCVAPVAKVILENFGIKKALMSTVHAYTTDQELQDGSHQDLRRARAAAANIVPTTTGAAKATAKIIPELSGRFDGLAFRVPVITGSVTDFVFLLEKQTNIEEVNAVLKKAAEEQLKGILGVTKKPVVSADIIGCEYSAMVDLSLTNVIEGDLLKIVAWYDNEWGYVNRLVEEILILGSKLTLT